LTSSGASSLAHPHRCGVDGCAAASDNRAVVECVVIGAGQAGLASSYHLTRLGVEHMVFERAKWRRRGGWPGGMAFI